jgi:ligand-binding SRPBCC domain-containing protein
MSFIEIEANKAGCLRMGQKDNLFTLETRLIIPLSPEKLFPFFADAGNLESITPPWLHFEILTPLPMEMRLGAFIEYHLRLHGISVRWLTEITLWEPPHRFVDEQKRGPYREWIHEHTFAERDGGCEMRDFVQYAVPGGWLTNRLFVRRNVQQIFEYRAQKLLGLFACCTDRAGKR